MARSARETSRNSKASLIGAGLLVASVVTLLAVAWKKTSAEQEANRSVLEADARDLAARVALSIGPSLRNLDPAGLIVLDDAEIDAPSGLDSWTEAFFELRNGEVVRPADLGPGLGDDKPQTTGIEDLSILDREAVARAYEAPPAERCARLLELGSRTTISPKVLATAAIDAGWQAERLGVEEDLQSALARTGELLEQLTPSPDRDSLTVSASVLALRHRLPVFDGFEDALVRLPSDLAAGTVSILREQESLPEARLEEIHARVRTATERQLRYFLARTSLSSHESPPDPRTGPKGLGGHLSVPLRSASAFGLLVVTPAELARLVSLRVGQTVRETAGSDGDFTRPEQVVANGWLFVEAPDWHLEDSNAAEQMVLIGLLLSIVLGAGLAWRSSRVEIRAARREAEFLTLVTHELKTPLTGIRVVAELLADGRVTDPEDHRRWLKRLDGEATRLGMLVENVLDLGRTERGETVHRPEAIDLLELCREVCTMFEPIAAQHGMELRLEIAEDAELAPRIWIDRDATKQALLNLCDNARKYGKDGRVIEVRIRREPDSIRCEVRDHGPGIASEERESIFERFQRGRSHRSGQIPGAGLGLHLARGIVHRDGGNLRVLDPDEGPGALFQIDWPLRDQPTNPTA
ncbi:MAG: HAMP domain-containing sensor histidine kinase [Planctomycetota bacterium]